MKKSTALLLLALLVSCSSLASAKSSSKGEKSYRNIEELPLAPSAPICSPSSAQAPIKIISWDPEQKAEKILGALEPCVSTQWDVLKLLSGPNAIGLTYPEEKEQWSYLSLWSYKLKNPIEETVILMDNPGKRVMRAKEPVELKIVFNEQDLVERVEMNLIKKR